MGIEQFDESKLIDERDLHYLRTKRDPEMQEAMYCTLTTYRRPDRLAVGDPVPALELTMLGRDEVQNLANNESRPTVLIFGSYT